MNISLAQLNYHIGNFESNFLKISESIKTAKSQKADLVVFSELAVCGYPPHDMLENKTFIDNCSKYINKIAALTTDIAVLVGAPSINPNEAGKRLYNSAFFLYEGEIKDVHHKSLLPTYDIFDEYRYFEPHYTPEVFTFKGVKLAITICEDLWYNQPVSNPFNKERLYNFSPMDVMSKQNPDIILNISASPFSHTRVEDKKQVFIDNAIKYNIPVITVNQVGAHTELIFDGASLVIDGKGQVIKQMASLDESIETVDIESLKPAEKAEDTNYIELMHDALIMGIRDYFQKSGFKKATLGLSGGIDSALTLALAQRALGSDKLHVLLMPSKYSSDHSVKDAVDMAEILGITYDIVPIEPAVKAFEAMTETMFADVTPDVTEENIQARVRGTMLMAYSNKFGHLLLNTTNKSEAAVGYGTLYGDLNGGIAVLADVYKGDVYKMSEFVNKDSVVIPINTIVKPPSAELRPDQKDSDSLPDYDILDDILYRYIELQQSANEIIPEGFEASVVNRIVRLVNFNEYKRFQSAPVLRVSSKAFGIGRKMPIVAKY